MDTDEHRSEEQRVAAIVENAGEDLLMFRCPGCKTHHAVRVRCAAGDTGPLWQWNGSLSHPTLQPSIIVTAIERPVRCHSWVTMGTITYLDDCDHDLRGQTVPLPPLED